MGGFLSAVAVVEDEQERATADSRGIQTTYQHATCSVDIVDESRLKGRPCFGT